MSTQTEQRLQLVRERLEYMDGRAKDLRRFERKILPHVKEKIRDAEEQNGRFQPLPPRLPRPEYVLTPGSLDRDDSSLEFYLACEEGRMAEVAAFVEIDGKRPSQGVLQYGLEQASFCFKAEVARYLLSKGAVLHTFCFMRTVKVLTDSSGVSWKEPCILDKCDQADTDSIISMLLAFIDVGSWHPNQPWESPINKQPYVALCTYIAGSERKVLEFLLAHGADPNLGSHNRSPDMFLRGWALNRQCPLLLNSAAADFDQSLVELLIRYGAKPDCEGLHMLHSVVRPHKQSDFATIRRPFAEYLLTRGLADVNEIRGMPWRHEGTRLMLGYYTDNETPLTYACAASDWEFVEWLLEHGADPDLLDGKAYQEQWWRKPYIGPNDPTRLRELIAQVKNKELKLPETIKKI